MLKLGIADKLQALFFILIDENSLSGSGQMKAGGNDKTLLFEIQ
jgi:hypothetical protein